MEAKNAASPEWQIANRSIAKLIATAVLVYIAIRLYPLFILLALAILLACPLHLAIKRLDKSLPHWASCLLITIAVIAVMVGTVGGIIPSLVEQFSAIAKKVPEMQVSIMKNLPEPVSRSVERFLHNPTIPTEHLTTAGQYLVGAISAFILIVVLALYLAADGTRVYDWLVAFFSKSRRKQIDKTADEAFSVIVAYVVGQLVTSVLAALFVFTVLTILKVPASLVLAVMAGIFDVLPILGFFLFAIPAVLFALTVSLQTALILLGLYLAYHLFENYFIVPKVYGSRLRLSDLVVLIAVLAGGYLAGIPGVIIILPLVAVYPAVERIWLKDFVGREVIEEHKKVEAEKN